MEWGMDTFSLKYSSTFRFLLVLERWGKLNKPSLSTPCLNVSVLKAEAYKKSKMAQLLEDLDQLKHETEELTVRLSSKEAEIVVLKAELLTTQSEEPGSSVVQALEKENNELKAKITALQEKAIKDNDAANARLTLVIQSLSKTPPSS